MNDSLLQTLQGGDWLFEEIGPKFRQSLLQRFPDAQDRSTTYLTARFYRGLLLPENGSPLPLQPVDVTGLTREGLHFWKNAIDALGREACLGPIDSEWTDTLARALEIIARERPQSAEALNRNVTYICTVDTDLFRSASHPHFFGTFFLRKTTDPVALAVSLVHELGHQELFLVNLIDRLIQSASDFQLAHAPYQGMTRPPIGRLHSAHALYRMIPLEEKILPDKAARHREMLKQTVASFGEEEATPFGKRILHEVY